MKLDNYWTAATGQTTYKGTMGKTQGYILGGLLVVGVSAVVWYRYFRVPKLSVYNVDTATDKAKIGLDNNKSVVLIKAGQSLPLSSNFHNYKVSAEAIKDTESSLTTGLKITLKDKDGKIISEQTKSYTA